MRSAFACVFIGNVLLLFHNLGFIDNGWIYAIASASCIGYGLATAELGWLARIAMQQEDAEGSFSILSIVPAAFLIGGLMTAFIFWAEWPFELIFALVSTVIAAEPLMKAQPLEKEGRRIGISSAGATDFMKAVSYLGVFSFTFGAVSQVANVTDGTSPSIEFQAVAGIVIAALAMAVVGHIRRRTPSLSNLYGMLFPIVALSLIALPFTASAARSVAVTLVFIAFYLSGMNARVIIVRLSQRDNVSLWVYLSVALGIRKVAASRDRVELEMDIVPTLFQPHGVLHGGATLSLLETAAMLAGMRGTHRSKTSADGRFTNESAPKSVSGASMA